VRKLVGLVFAAPAATLLLALSAGQALATTIHCGDVITQDTTLDSDLIDCPGDGIVIGANNVTLDLNGHTVDGPKPSGLGQPGISVARSLNNPHGIVIRGGTVKQFTYGVALQSAQAVVTDMTIADNIRGLQAYYSDLVFEHSVAAGNEEGVLVVDGSSSSIRDNTLSDNLDGVDLDTEAREVGGRGQGPIHVTDNVVQRNSNGIHVGQYYNVPFAGFETAGNRLIDNGWGIQVPCAGSVSQNEINGTGNIWAVLVYAPDNKAGCSIDGNRIVASKTTGIGVYAVDAHVSGNSISGSGRDGIFFGPRDTFSPCSQYACVPGSPPVAEGNTTDANGNDGIDSTIPGARITSNHAWFNGNLGIEAVPGTLGGGNWAKHNGNPFQCVPGSLCSTTGRPKG
jgi:hypothetical protein